MQNINYRNLKPGQKITVVTAWTETETFEDVTNGHFFNTEIEAVYFEPRGDVAFLRVFAKDGDGISRRVNYLLEEGQIKSTGVVVSLEEFKAESEMICLSDRKREFAEAIQRAEKSNLEVYADFEPDTFVVVNRSNGHEYRVMLKTKDGQVFARCECADFIHRERICKHISEVLTDMIFGHLARKIENQAAAVYAVSGLPAQYRWK